MDMTSASNSDGLLKRGVRIARSILVSRENCVDNAQVNTCEKPAISTNSKIGIGAAIG
jgi:hypothetical protein